MATQPNGDIEMNANDAKTNDGIEASEVLDTLVIKKVQRRTSCGGAWVVGTIAGHRFDALVFPEPATNREWEVGGDSRISKLWIQRISDKATVYNWDRGADIEPTTELAGVIVELLAAGLADHIWNA
ncbi:MAG: hypothetical protein HZB38_02480 [Planctomycetes bacterium]|nr:hypothetical protein [Planctomycetota bacterium]